MNRLLRIPAGGMYQEWMSMIDLLEQEKAQELEMVAANKGWREVQPYDAEIMGFKELSEWSVKETDVLVLIDDNYLVCMKKNDYQSSIC